MPNKNITKARMKRHIKTGGCDIYDEGCLFCGKGDEYGDSIECEEFMPVENGDIHQKCTCKECGRQWIDVFRLVEAHELSS
jgi:hypothetical protein